MLGRCSPGGRRGPRSPSSCARSATIRCASGCGECSMLAHLSLRSAGWALGVRPGAGGARRGAGGRPRRGASVSCTAGAGPGSGLDLPRPRVPLPAPAPHAVVGRDGELAVAAVVAWARTRRERRPGWWFAGPAVPARRRLWPPSLAEEVAEAGSPGAGGRAPRACRGSWLRSASRGPRGPIPSPGRLVLLRWAVRARSPGRRRDRSWDLGSHWPRRRFYASVVPPTRGRRGRGPTSHRVMAVGPESWPRRACHSRARSPSSASRAGQRLGAAVDLAERSSGQTRLASPGQT